MLKKAISAILLVVIVLSCCACGPKGTGRKVPVTFKLNNGFGEVVVEMDEGIPLKNAPTPTMRGAEFAGWVYDGKMWDMKSNVTEGLVLSARWKLASDIFEPDPNAGAVSEGTDLRVCSFNALKTEGANLTDVKPRIQGMLDMLKNYKMDIVSYQEFDQYWRSYFTSRAKQQELPYKLVSQSVKGSVTSAFHNIAYNTERVTLLECGVEKYETPSGYANDFMWAKFETKDTAKRQFYVLSFAWNWNQPDVRMEQSELVSAWINEKRAESNLPVISMGDYNDVESSAPCQNILEKVQMKDAKQEAPRKGLVGKSFHTMPEPDSYTNAELNTLETIDHIYYTGELSALYYDVITSNYVLEVSDHNAIYADLKFN